MRAERDSDIADRYCGSSALRRVCWDRLERGMYGVGIARAVCGGDAAVDAHKLRVELLCGSRCHGRAVSANGRILSTNGHSYCRSNYPQPYNYHSHNYHSHNGADDFGTQHAGPVDCHAHDCTTQHCQALEFRTINTIKFRTINTINTIINTINIAQYHSAVEGPPHRGSYDYLGTLRICRNCGSRSARASSRSVGSDGHRDESELAEQNTRRHRPARVPPLGCVCSVLFKFLTLAP